MYGAGPFDALSFAEDNMVGTLGIVLVRQSSHRVCAGTHGSNAGKVPYTIQDRLSVDYPMMVIRATTNRIQYNPRHAYSDLAV